MTHFPVSTTNEQIIHAALELSKNSWLLAIQSPVRDNPSLHPIRGGDAEGLMAKLDAARERVAKVTGEVLQVTLCYEAGYDGFWLARFLDQRGIICHVMEPASLQVNRRARRVKTDRIDVEERHDDPFSSIYFQRAPYSRSFGAQQEQLAFGDPVSGAG